MNEQQHVETSTPTVPATATPRELARRVEELVEREPQDAVRCVHLFDSFYRCNWWTRLGDRPSGRDFDWGGLATDHIRKSRFLKVTVRGEQLVLEDVPPRSTAEISGR